MMDSVLLFLCCPAFIPLRADNGLNGLELTVSLSASLGRLNCISCKEESNFLHGTVMGAKVKDYFVTSYYNTKSFQVSLGHVNFQKKLKPSDVKLLNEVPESGFKA